MAWRMPPTDEPVAQLVEHRTFNAVVAGSSPARLTISSLKPGEKVISVSFPPLDPPSRSQLNPIAEVVRQPANRFEFPGQVTGS